MDDIWTFRPLLWAVIEFALVTYILLKGKGKTKHILAAIALFIGGYQFGEFLILADAPHDLGTRVAFFSTTLLPPLGIIALEAVHKRWYGGSIMLVFFGLYATAYAVNPGFISHVNDQYCILKYQAAAEHDQFIRVWYIAYVLGLTYAIGIILGNLYKDLKNKRDKVGFDIKMLFAYLAFFPTGYLITLAFDESGFAVSAICALAIFTAFILAHLSKDIGDEGWEWKIKHPF